MTACCGAGAALNFGAYEGQWASPPLNANLALAAPFASVLAGPLAPRSSSPGTIQGRFGWLAPDGLVYNARQTAQDSLGVVIPYRSMSGVNGGVVGGPRGIAGTQASWTWEFWDPAVGAFRARPGLVVTLHARGNFWLRFAAGAIYGNTVYASLADGTALSGPADNSEATPFTVCSEATPGSLGIVSSTAIFTT
jgi:hypothetical protein